MSTDDVKEKRKKAKETIEKKIKEMGYEITKPKSDEHGRHAFIAEKSGENRPVEIYTFQSTKVSSPLLHNKDRLKEMIDEDGWFIIANVTDDEIRQIPAKDLQPAYDGWHEEKHPIRIPVDVLRNSDYL